MKSIAAYVRNLLGWCDDDPEIRTSFKRDRADDEFSFEDDLPAVKRIKQLNRSSFPDVMASNDPWNRQEKQSKVRYVPIHVEAGHPSTSTPNDPEKYLHRMRSVPMKLVGPSVNKPSPPTRKPRMHTPVRPVLHALIDDDDDDEPEVTLVEHKPDNSKKPSKVYINLDDYDNDPDLDEDVIFVKKVTTPPPVKPYKFFVAQSNDTTDSEEPKYYRLSRKTNDRGSILSPKNYSKFKAPPGVTKVYKRPPPPVARWLQPQRTSNMSAKSRYLNGNGNSRSTIAEVFNLDEKRSYQELIRKVTETAKLVTPSKPIETVNLAEDSASFRMTQRSQKSALNEIKLFEKGLLADKENEASKEYDPVTVASINSSDSEIEVVPSESSNSSVRIDPINTFKDSLKDKSITSNDWLQKLESKYRRKRFDIQEKVKDARRESDIISKVNDEQKLALLEHKLKYELSIPESLIEEPQPTVELPELTPEQEKLVSRAIGPGPANQLLVEKFNLRIHRRDLQTLAGLNWLNDEVINFYMNLVMQRCAARRDLPRAYATNTFFYPKLLQAGQAGLRRWTKKVDIFSHALIIVPVHLGVHWCLSIVDFREKKVKYYDSMGAANKACVNALLQYLRDEHKDKKGQPFDDSGWTTECLKNIPQQMNGSDCGMFACTFAEFASRDAPFTFSQQDMPYLRRKAALEILLGRLLL